MNEDNPRVTIRYVYVPESDREKRLLAEIERLKDLLSKVDVSVEKLKYAKSLLGRAADALECYNLDHLQDDLITELRKAAE